MTPSHREPTHEELLAMAYADGELAPAERREFERLLESRADLRQEVVRLQRLALLARQAAGPEPIDLEWRRLALDPVQRAGLGLGWSLLLCGALAGLGSAGYVLWTSDAPLLLKLSASSVVGGFALLLALALRARARTRTFDPYTEIQR
ncbi:MAG: hypothetical protein IT454_21730 [Planctomycetes bacterium]|nr:hypothetical protein [Planctomycetota bacterium]